MFVEITVAALFVHSLLLDLSLGLWNLLLGDVISGYCTLLRHLFYEKDSTEDLYPPLFYFFISIPLHPSVRPSFTIPIFPLFSAPTCHNPTPAPTPKITPTLKSHHTTSQLHLCFRSRSRFRFAYEYAMLMVLQQVAAESSVSRSEPWSRDGS